MTAATLQEDVLAGYQAVFDQVDTSREPAWVHALRSAAMRRLVERGLPALRDEAWPYTNLRPLTSETFALARPGSDALTGDPLEGVLPLSPFTPRLIMRNGVLDPVASQPDERFTFHLADATPEQRALVEQHLHTHARRRGSAFVELNAALLQDIAVLHVPADTHMPGPLLVIHVAEPMEGPPAAAHPRLLVLAERGAEAKVVEVYARPPGGTALVNAVTEVVVAENASVRHFRLHMEGSEALHVGSSAIHLARDARYVTTAITTGAAIARHDIHVIASAPGAQCELNGLYVLHGDDHADTAVTVEHETPHGNSAQLYKSILDDEARSGFTGRVIVREGASQTLATQTNHNLLLSRQAVADTRPQLEIYNDDVQCAHGATVGQLDEDAHFYLRSRGLGAAEARKLLIRAFAHEVVDTLQNETLRADIHRLIDAQLDAAAVKAS